MDNKNNSWVNTRQVEDVQRLMRVFLLELSFGDIWQQAQLNNNTNKLIHELSGFYFQIFRQLMDTKFVNVNPAAIDDFCKTFQVLFYNLRFYSMFNFKKMYEY